MQKHCLTRSKERKLGINLYFSELCKENFADEPDMTEEEMEEELAIIRYY